jgi:hypothetical protein
MHLWLKVYWQNHLKSDDSNRSRSSTGWITSRCKGLHASHKPPAILRQMHFSRHPSACGGSWSYKHVFQRKWHCLLNEYEDMLHFMWRKISFSLFFKISYRVSNMARVNLLTNPSIITKELNIVRFEIFKAVSYDVVPCNIFCYRHLGRISCLHLPSRRFVETCCLQDRKLIFHTKNGDNMFKRNVGNDHDTTSSNSNRQTE